MRNRIKIYKLPFNKVRSGYLGRKIGAWKFLEISGSFQADYIFINFLFWTIRIKREYKD